MWFILWLFHHRVKISALFLFGLFQGHFTHWVDGSPLLDPGWYEHVDTSFKTYTAYDLSTNRITRNAVLNVSLFNKQPEYNIDKNCTALLVGHHFTRYTWIVIPCDQNFTATYFCQSKLLLPTINYRTDLNPLNSTCDQGWYMISNSPVCYRLWQPDRAISFHEGEKACSAKNASIYRVALTNEPPVDDTSLKKWFSSQYGDIFPKSSYLKKGIRKILFGRLLDNRIIRNVLPRIVKSHNNSNMRVLATGRPTGAKSCGMVESLTFQTVLSDQRGPLRERWFFKYRPCFKNINIISLICEKPSTKYKQTCSSLYFQCSDGTCVLLIYTCDMSYDCFDGSDETGCSYNLTDTVTQTTSMRLSDYIPCSLDYDCLLYTKSKSILLPIHSPGDGIYNTKWLQENNNCNINKLIIIQLSYMIGININRMPSFTDSSALINVLEQELPYFENVVGLNGYQVKHTFNSSQQLIFNSYVTNCQFDGNGRDIDTMCKMSAHIPPCKSIYLTRICTFIWCPGMFKCIHTYCLPMSVICNGHQECPDGEDELYCSNLVCPGLLKCRGESRCVSTGEICDGQVNCQYSFDDEIMCEQCPIGCICHYYFMSCAEIKNVLPGVEHKNYPYVKGISFKGRITNITIEYFVTYLALIYIDISHCGIERMTAVGKSVLSAPNILFVDIQYNDLIHTSFLSSSTLSKLVSIDLSHNKITHISSKLIQMYRIKVLRLGENPLRYIYFDFLETYDDHRIIDILFTEYSDQMNIYINTMNHTSIEVRVTDPFMCCTLNVQCKIINIRSNSLCFQFIKTESLKYTFYFISSTAVVVSITRLLVIIYRSITYQNTNHLNVIRINQSLCEVLMCTYFISIFINTALNNNVILWRKSIICRIMSWFLYLTLSNGMVFKTFSVIIMSLKIKFPFKHQCRWLRFAALSAIMAWLCSCFIFLLSVILTIIVDTYLYLDRFCTFGECNTRIDKLVFIHFTIIVIDNICTYSSFSVGIQSFLVLKRRAIESSHKDISAFSIMFKIGKLCYIEILFRFFLYIVFVAKLTQITLHEEYCVGYFLLLLPLQCILSGAIDLMI